MDGYVVNIQGEYLNFPIFIQGNKEPISLHRIDEIKDYCILGLNSWKYLALSPLIQNK
jgi:hypothetical protein